MLLCVVTVAFQEEFLGFQSWPWSSVDVSMFSVFAFSLLNVFFFPFNSEYVLRKALDNATSQLYLVTVAKRDKVIITHNYCSGVPWLLVYVQSSVTYDTYDLCVIDPVH